MNKNGMRSRMASVEMLEPRRMLAAGDLAWATTFGFPEEIATGSALATDAAGNTYVAGSFFGRIDVDPSKKVKFIKSQGRGQDIFLVKYAPDSKLLWARRYGGEGENTATALKIGPSGDVYLAGTYEKTPDFGVGKTAVPLRSHGKLDGFVARVNGAGKVTWVGHIGGKRDDFITAIEPSADGDVFIAGTIRLSGNVDPAKRGVRGITTRGADDTFVAKLNGTSGALRPGWPRVYGENDTLESVQGLAADGQGGVYVAGTFLRTVQFDRQRPAFTRSSSDDDQDIYLGRLDANANWQWLKTIGGEDQDTVQAMQRTANGDLVITGNFGEVVDFDPGPRKQVLEALGESDVFVLKMTGQGTLKWVRQISPDPDNDGVVLAGAVAVDPAGNVYAAGQFNETILVSPGPGQKVLSVDKDGGIPRLAISTTYLLPFRLRATDAYITKFSANGALVYAKQIGGEDGNILANGIGADASGAAYVTGTFADTVDLNPGRPILRKRTAEDDEGSDVYVLKLE